MMKVNNLGQKLAILATGVSLATANFGCTSTSKYSAQGFSEDADGNRTLGPKVGVLVGGGLGTSKEAHFTNVNMGVGTNATFVVDSVAVRTKAPIEQGVDVLNAAANATLSGAAVGAVSKWNGRVAEPTTVNAAGGAGGQGGNAGVNIGNGGGHGGHNGGGHH